jgi:mannosyltransferase OCH1-like enzyme
MIPKIIHQTWKTSNIPNKWKEYHNTWKKHFPEPEYQHILWTDEVNKDFIKENYNWFYNTFSGYPKGIQRADAIRYFILFHYGGIYADLDCEVRENFYQDLEQDNINLAGNPYENGKSTMNNLMCSDKNNDKWKKVFQELEKRKKNLSTLDSTGPVVLNSLTNHDIKILDYKQFNPLKKRNFLRYHIENTFFMPLDKEKMKTWDIAKVVHHGSESWAYDEIKCLLYNNIIFILTILCLITYLIFKYKKITIF